MEVQNPPVPIGTIVAVVRERLRALRGKKHKIEEKLKALQPLLSDLSFSGRVSQGELPQMILGPSNRDTQLCRKLEKVVLELGVWERVRDLYPPDCHSCHGRGRHGGMPGAIGGSHECGLCGGSGIYDIEAKRAQMQAVLEKAGEKVPLVNPEDLK